MNLENKVQDMREKTVKELSPDALGQLRSINNYITNTTTTQTQKRKALGEFDRQVKKLERKGQYTDYLQYMSNAYHEQLKYGRVMYA